MNWKHVLSTPLSPSLFCNPKSIIICLPKSVQHVHLISFELLLYVRSSPRLSCSLVVTRAPVAPQVLGSIPRGSEFPGFNSVCAFSGRRRFCRQRDACGDFVNLKDLPAQSSKMLLGVGFAWVILFMVGYRPARGLYTLLTDTDLVGHNLLGNLCKGHVASLCNHTSVV
jgi:hypothetical protein